MNPLSLLAILLVLASFFGLLNYHLLKLPRAIGQIVVALAASLALIGIDMVAPGLGLSQRSQAVLGTDDLPQMLLQGALAFLLFAGCLEVDTSVLLDRKLTVFLLATVGVVLATALFGAGIWLILRLVGVNAPLAWCLVLGAALAPTDPVAVTEMLARVGLPKPVQAVMAGESLFNDGVGVLAFALTSSIALSHAGGAQVGAILARGALSAVGSALLGYVLARGVDQLIRRVDDSPLEILISLGLAAGVYALAGALGGSGPIAVVVAGLFFSRTRDDATSERTRASLSLFWSLIEEILNALLFLLLGFEILGLRFAAPALIAALAAIPLALLVRGVSIVAPIYWLHARNPALWPNAAILTWGGLRGGISVALALSLAQTPWRDTFLFVAYAVALFTILAQGLTVEKLARRLYAPTEARRN